MSHPHRRNISLKRIFFLNYKNQYVVSFNGQLLKQDQFFETCQGSNQGKEATYQKLQEANKVIRKMAEPASIVFPNLGNPKDLKILVYGDGSHASLAS